MSKRKQCALSSSNNHLLKTISRFDKTCVSYKWRIEDFHLSPSKYSQVTASPWVKCSDTDWRLLLFANGKTYFDEGFVSILLEKQNSQTEKRVDFEVGLEDINGIVRYRKETKCDFPTEVSRFGLSKFIERKLLFKERLAELLPDGALNISCKITVIGDVVHDSLESVLEERIAIKKENVTSVPNGTQTLVKDLECLLREQRKCDVILQVGDEKFPAHKLLLGARSSVFAAMFEHDMSESRSNVVNVPDIECAVMRDLLLYMYSGNVGEMSLENALGLYTAADKYALLELKAHCSDFLLEKLSVDNACDLAVFANAHNDGTILDAIKIFARHNYSLLSTEKWKNFLEQNTRLAYEITLALTLKR